MAVRPMAVRLNGTASPFVNDPRTTEFWLVVLVLIEVGLLVVLRRYFGLRAHGG